MPKVIISTVFVLSTVLSLGCKNDWDSLLQLDLSAEIDAGRFNPDAGDEISIAGDFNEWKPHSLFLMDTDGDGVYQLSLKNLALRAVRPLVLSDTIAFKFVHRPGNERLVANEGWETIEPRIATLTALGQNEKPLRFNRPFDDRLLGEASFVVNMRSQAVLGFFQPERGDRVVVTGDFLNWDEEGVPLRSQDRQGVYSAIVPVLYRTGQPVSYKFRIRPGESASLPNDGWEMRPDRQLDMKTEKLEAPFAVFSDIRRVARFLIDSEQWARSGEFDPANGDVLQISLDLDGSPALSDALFHVKDHEYETAVAIPLTVQEVHWQVVKNLGTEVLTPKRQVEIDLDGRVLKWPDG